MHSGHKWLGLSVVAMIVAFSTSVTAEQLVDEVVDERFEEELDENQEATDEIDDFTGLHLRSSLQIRPFPVGLSLRTQAGYTLPLFDSESPLLADTFFDAGVSTALSPASIWAGPYIEILPLAVLNLRFTAQFMGYFGNFGYLYVPDDSDGEWNQSALDESSDQGLGQSSTGVLLEAQVTPQMKMGRVVFQAPSEFSWMRMNVDGPYYEPYYDLFFAPTDTFWVTRPTLGYLFGKDLSESYLMLGARWERVAVTNTDVVRDTLGVVFNWKIPPSIVEWGDPSLSGFGGLFVDHPNRGRISPYLGMQALVQF